MKTARRVLLAAALAATLPGTVRGGEVRVRPEMITPEAEQAIQKGLAYLVRTQARNGSWRSEAMGGVYPTAMTALGGLAIMAAGNTPCEGEYSDNVRRAVYFLLSSANRSGYITAMMEEQRGMHGHGFATMFLAQAYGAEQDTDLQRRLHEVITRAVALTARSQSFNGGWLYSPDSNGDEGSVTVTQIQALRAARNAGIKVPKSTVTRAGEYIRKCANEDGGISYSLMSRGSRPAISAAAVATLYNAGQYENPVALKALEYLKKLLKGSNSATVFQGHRFYALLYTSQAMFFSGEEDWREFFPKHRDELIKQQKSDGSWQGDFAGHVYGTAIALLVLQLPYQYLPILQR
ncbi:MAG TPA: prenyltransferase/squalene oxidase repeat-containing protein [Planctomycetota bacterium]|nr:prenyltransferase/squalene oxidase repeat-containing protein [Planctomycetota bacterium]